MFLTTNLERRIDPAFQSRIHISLEYPPLSLESRRMVWGNFLENLSIKHNISATELNKLAHMNVNGRQVKNLLKTAQLLARRKDSALKYEHISTVLDVTQHLHNTSQETERNRASIFC